MTENEQSQEEKPNFLSVGINQAVPPRGSAPPPPPHVKRPRERDEDSPSQLSENANSQIRKEANVQPVVQPEQETTSVSVSLTDEQVRQLAEMLTSASANPQSEKKAKRQKIDLADLLIQTIANTEGSENIKEQFRKLANSQKTKINQGVFAPEALFTIYNSTSAQMKLAGKKVGMGDLMAKALIAYVPELIKELEQL